jgi:hypothetical protein
MPRFRVQLWLDGRAVHEIVETDDWWAAQQIIEARYGEKTWLIEELKTPSTSADEHRDQDNGDGPEMDGGTALGVLFLVAAFLGWLLAPWTTIIAWLQEVLSLAK